jgi:hypothetical protein
LSVVALYRLKAYIKTKKKGKTELVLPFGTALIECLDGYDVLCLGSFLTLSNFELDFLAFSQ